MGNRKNKASVAKKRQARWLYIEEAMTLKAIGKKLSICATTVSRYKAQDKATDLDWDEANQVKEKEPTVNFSKIVEELAEFIRQTIVEVKEMPETTAAEKVKLLASLTSSLTRTIAGSRKFEPDILLEVVISELLEVVGQELTKLDNKAAHCFAMSLEVIKQEINKRKRSWQN